MHDLPLITTIALAFSAAWLLGLITQRIGLSPIVGYLLAGVVVGPHTPGVHADVHIAQQLAEIGVILLMFGVGLHLHLDELLAVKSAAVPGTIAHSLIATLAGVPAFMALGFPVGASFVVGLALSVASTVVLMRVLMDADALNTPPGHMAVGWLLVEDIFTVVVLVLIPVLAPGAGQAASAGSGLAVSLALAFLKLSVLVGLVLVFGPRAIPWVLAKVVKLRSRELFTLTVLVFSVAVAAGAYFVFGASMALGAFLAGMVVAQSPVSHQAAADALPMRDAFAVLFFVSVGMLFDPRFLVDQPGMVLAALGIILLIKPLSALAIVAVLGYSSRTALTVAVGLAQIGEFSFILSELARKHGLMPDVGHNVLVAAAIISITLNPLFFRALGPAEAWLRRHPRWWNLLNARAERRARVGNAAVTKSVRTEDPQRLAIVVGYGPVGRAVDRMLQEVGLATVIIDLNMDTVAELNQNGRAAIFGDAGREVILERAGIRRASHLLLTLPHFSERAAIVSVARNLNADLRILVRARYLGERGNLTQAGATAAVFEEAEAALALAELVVSDMGVSRDAVERTMDELRKTLIPERKLPSKP